MKVKVIEHDGSMEVRDVAAILFMPTCKNSDCTKKEFDTPDPRKEYCSYECQERAKYRRWQRK